MDKFLRKLSSHERKILSLKYKQGYSIKDIAEYFDDDPCKIKNDWLDMLGFLTESVRDHFAE